MKKFHQIAAAAALLTLLSCTKKQDPSSQNGADSGVDTGPAVRVVVFMTNSQFTGKLGGRAGADSRCQTARTAGQVPLRCTHLSAVLSISDTDTVEKLPATAGFSSTLPVMRPDRSTVIAKDWATFVTGPLEKSVGTGPGTYWTGATPGGGAAPETCQGFTSGETADRGVNGDQTDDKLGAWKNQGSVTCDTPQGLLCACW